MKMRNGMLVAAAGVGIMLIREQPLGAQQVVPPTKAKDQTMKTLASFDLSSEMPELTGRYLRARVRTIQPGGHGALHSHPRRSCDPVRYKRNVDNLYAGWQVHRS